MIVRFVAAITAAVLSAGPALAEWKHAPSGVSLPDAVGEMRVGAQRDVAGDGTDVYVQYGTDDEPVTLYVYRSSHPSPALWFERTRAAMVGNVGQFDQAAPSRSFSLGSASAANGLRGEFALAGQPWRATAVAIAQHGEWLIKARVTSKTLDQAGVATKMDALLGAVRLAETPKDPPFPLTAPGACADATAFQGKVKRSDEARAMGAVIGLVALAESRTGATGLSGRPAEWCRQDVGELAKSISFYRKRDGTAWTMLLGDAGLTASAYAYPAGMKKPGAALYLTRTGPVQLVETFDRLPRMEDGTSATLAVLSGQRPALATISVGKK